MPKLFLITHPEVIINPDQAIDEWSLSDIGIARAQSLLQETFCKNIGSIYTSTEPKTKIVAEMVAKKFDLPVIEKECLVEIDRSSTRHIPYEEFMKVVYQFFSQPNESIRGWETAFAATHRVVKCIANILVTEQNEQIACIGHDAIFALLLSYVKRIEPTIDMDQDSAGSITVVDWNTREIISAWKKY